MKIVRRLMVVALVASRFFDAEAGPGAEPAPAGPPKSSAPAGVTGDELFTTEIGTIAVGGRQLRIWASTRNAEARPEQMQFRFDPLILPAIGADGKVAAVGPTDLGGRWAVGFDLVLNQDEVNAMALLKVRELNPAAGDKIAAGNVFPRQILWLEVGLGEETVQAFPSARLARRTWSMATPQARARVTLTVETRDEAAALAKALDRVVLNLKWATKAATTLVNRTEVTSRHLNNSELFAKLNGLGEPVVYVRRHDLRRMIDDLRTEIIGRVAVENPERWSDDLLRGLLEKHLTRVRVLAAEHAGHKWKATYHGDDLKPDVLTKTLNKVFVHDAGKNQWKVDAALDTSGKADVVGLFGAEGSLKAHYSKDELIEFLRQRNIEVSIEGTIIVPKVIDLLQVTMAELKDKFQTTVEWVEVKPPHIVELPETIDLGHKADEAGKALAEVRQFVAEKNLEAATKAMAASRKAATSPPTDWLTAKGKAALTEANALVTAADKLKDQADEFRRAGEPAKAAEVYAKAKSNLVAAREGFDTAAGGVVPEQITSIALTATTGDEDKEKEGCMKVELKRNGAVVWSHEDGARVHWGDNQVKKYSLAAALAISDGPLEFVAHCYDVPGERNVEWVAKFEMTATTNRGRTLSAASGFHRFNTGKGVTDLSVGTLK